MRSAGLVRFPIKYKLFSIIFIAFITMLVSISYHFFEMLNDAREEIKSENLDIAIEVSKDLDDLIDKSFAILNTLSKHPAVIAKDSKESDRLFADVLRMHPEYLNIIAAGMDGYNYGSAVPAKDIRKLNFNGVEWFITAKTGKPVVGDLHISKLFKFPAVMISFPVVDRRGKQVGVIGLPLKISDIRDRFLKTIKLPEKAALIVLDSKGIVVFCSLHEEMSGSIGKDMPLLFKAIVSEHGSVEDTGMDGITRLYSLSSMSNAGWKVAVGVPVKMAYVSAYAMASKHTYIFFIGTVIAIALSMMVSRRITDNLSRLSKGIKEIEQGDLSYHLELSGHDELQEVAQAFNRMVIERSKAETRLKESEAFLSTVLNGIGEGVVVIDREFRISSANDGYCRQVGRSCEDILGRHCYEISHHMERPCFEDERGCECTVKKCFETGEHHRSLHTHYDIKGSPAYIETNAYPLRDSSGNIISAIETLINVTDMVLLEKRLEDIKERYRKLYDDAPDMMHSVDKNGIVIVCNRTETEVLGYEFSEIINRPLKDIFAPESAETLVNNIDLLVKTGFFEGERVFLAKDGRKIPVYMRSRAMYDEEGNFLMSDTISRDISEKKALEAQLLQAQKMEAVGMLAGGVAHDFNNILSAIIGYANLMQMKAGHDGLLMNYVDQILSASERAVNLTRSLLAFSRKQIIDPRPVDLNEIIRNSEKLLERLTTEDIGFKTFLADRELTILADRGQIEQVLMNLTANARDSMPEGGDLVIETEEFVFDEDYVKIHGYGAPGVYAMISVTDTGKGMDEKTRERIFDPFFTTKESGKGTGLGLSMVYGIVKQHNGFINVYSEPGRGTTFRVYLPVIREKPEEVRKKDKAVAVAGGTETILIAEDEAEVRGAMKAILQEFGYSVIEAVDGEDAVMVFVENKDVIKLVVIDVIMPKKNGKEAYEEMRRLDPDIKVIFMSGYTANIIHKKWVLDKGIDFISKPIAVNVLLRKIREALDK